MTPQRAPEGSSPGNRTPAAPGWILLPREHGAWSMLLLPFAAAAVLSRTFSLALAAAVVATLVTFLLREPLIILARQRRVWREPHPESVVAGRSLLVLLPLLGAVGIFLVTRLPWKPLLLFGAAAMLLTLAAVEVTLQNRQRSSLWQALSATALSASALFGALAGSGEIPPWAWVLWLVFALHHIGAIFLVHARLQSLIASRVSPSSPASRIQAATAASAMQSGLTAQIPLALAALYFAFTPHRLLSLPLVLSLAVHLWEWKTMGDSLKRPLKEVGFRALGFSIVFAALAVWALSYA